MSQPVRGVIFRCLLKALRYWFYRHFTITDFAIQKYHCGCYRYYTQVIMPVTTYATSCQSSGYSHVRLFVHLPSVPKQHSVFKLGTETDWDVP